MLPEKNEFYCLVWVSFRAFSMRDRLISKHREAIQRSDFYLKGTNGLRLEAQIGLEILSNLTDQSLEWKFADQQLS